MDYRSPGTVKQAVELLATHNGAAYVLAGGTDLLVKLRAGMVAPQIVVDLKAIPQLRGIAADARGFRIGAATSCAEIGEHAALGKAWPGVVEALQLIGSTQIQGRATAGGNLCNASPAADSVPRAAATSATDLRWFSRTCSNAVRARSIACGESHFASASSRARL